MRPEPTNYDADGHVAEIYDASETHMDDVELVRRLIGGRAPWRVRDPFCGTGRMLIPLAEGGHTLVGSDLSPAMLRRCRAKAATLPPEVRARIRLSRAEAVRTSWGEGFDLVLLGANCLYEFGSERDQRACVRRAADCLRPGGHAFVDNEARRGSVSKADLCRRDPAFPTGECADGTRLRARFEIHRVERERNLWFMRRRLTIESPDGAVQNREWETVTRPVSMEEVRGWLEGAGFQVLELFGDRAGTPFTPDSGRAIFWARRQ
jgi:SAM-dependent methyltransferase